MRSILDETFDRIVGYIRNEENNNPSVFGTDLLRELDSIPRFDFIDNQRYFLFTYSAGDGSVGNFALANDEFPSNENVKRFIQKHANLNCKIAITNIYEFQSKEDYDNFYKT